MRNLIFLTCATCALLWSGGPAASEDKPAAKEVKPFEGALGKIREASARARSANSLKQLGLAMHMHQDKYGAFPAAATYDKAGKALLSWRVAILPFIDQQKLYDEFKQDEAWDSAHNKKLVAKMPKLFAFPDGSGKAGHTFYQAYVGKGAAFEGKKGIKIADFTDGTSNTILLVEAGSEVPWTKPVDLDYQPGKKLPAVSRFFTGGFNALFADGSVRFLPSGINAKTLEALITRNGGEVIGKND